MNKLKQWIAKLPFPIYKLALYCFSLLLIGVASSAIYWPAGFIIVGGLLWLDLFLTDFIYVIKSDRDREEPTQQGRR